LTCLSFLQGKYRQRGGGVSEDSLVSRLHSTRPESIPYCCADMKQPSALGDG
jgi:hypothetical protein